MVAYRVADELGLGIRLDTKKLSFQSVRKAAHKVLAYSSYSDRVKSLSEISQTYKGVKAANEIIFEFLNK